MAHNRPRRRRHYRRNRIHGYRRRRSFSRNPGMSIAGFQLPPMDAVLFVGVGFVVPPMVTSFIMNYIPDAWKQSKITYYGVKAASVLIPSMLVRRFISVRAGNMMLIGGAASFLIDLARESGLLHGMGYQNMIGYYPPRALGAYGAARVPRGPGIPAHLPPMIASAPDRLDPTSRF